MLERQEAGGLKTKDCLEYIAELVFTPYPLPGLKISY
jgi:hypothetical protein